MCPLSMCVCSSDSETGHTRLHISSAAFARLRRRRIRFKYIYIYPFIVNSPLNASLHVVVTEMIVKGTKIKYNNYSLCVTHDKILSISAFNAQGAGGNK